MSKKRKTSKKKAAKRKPARRSTARKTRKRRPARPWWRRHWILSSLGVATLAFGIWALWLDYQITARFETRRWDLPARVYAQPLELYAGRRLAPDQLVLHLHQLGYAADASLSRPGSYRRDGARFEIYRRAAEFWDGKETARGLRVGITDDRVAALSVSGRDAAVVRLDPLVIGSLFPAHGEDRVVLEPDTVPALLADTLRLVEDRRFEQHHGLDVRAIARAALANLRAGGIRQGGSTLTQQLVKSYFLTNERTFRRKVREAVMAVLLELRYDKREILTAYVNEVYLGQDGARAIHGFGLASQFYFARPLAELDPAQVATLVALVRGPSFYDPNRFADRLRERRDRILTAMAKTGVIDEAARDRALATPLAVADRSASEAAYFPAFVDVVRRQLERDYDDADLRREGLSIHTTLDPLAQALALTELDAHLARLEAAGAPELQGAVVVADPRVGELHALVGGRGRGGFNRALDARRQVGSLIKPIVYLAALESGDWHMASSVEDAPVEIAQEDGSLWSPQNFSGEHEGEMPLVRALAESVNVASVRVGMSTGLKRIAGTLRQLGGPDISQPYGSLTLGAVEMSPVDVANVYLSLGSGGLRPPLRAVREVVGGDGDTVQRYPLTIDTVADGAALYALNTALVATMTRGTGRAAVLPEGLVAAGKTGTTNDFRDAWFAGYTGDRLGVVWVGTDDNAPTGLTGSRGALPVWSAVIAELSGEPLRLSVPEGMVAASVDYATGRQVAARCDNAVTLGVPEDVRLDTQRGCGGRGVAARALDWLRDRL
ncbi:MAG: penicillin-binding protein 1B [Pseudomonadota bacterium]